MQSLRQTDFMFHADSTNGVWRPKTGEEETEDTLLIPANALKYHISQVKKTDVFFILLAQQKKFSLV